MTYRKDGRSPLEMRKLILTRNFLPHAEGSCLVELGMTRVIITASIENGVPQWRSGRGTGWITAEYGMLPRSTHKRIKRPSIALHTQGRSMEIQRLIGRALRAVTRLDALGERTIYVDCDVINADGGTRTASIIGASIALHETGTRLMSEGYTEEFIMKGLVSAISVGILRGETVVDLCYEEDSAAEVDMNIIMTESCDLIEVQGTAEGHTFDRVTLNTMIDAAESAIQTITRIQREILELT